MEGGDPTGVIINHLGSKTFQIVIGGRGQGKEGREKIKRPLMGVIYLYNSTCRMEAAQLLRWQGFCSLTGLWRLKSADGGRGLEVSHGCHFHPSGLSGVKGKICFPKTREEMELDKRQSGPTWTTSQFCTVTYENVLIYSLQKASRDRKLRNKAMSPRPSPIERKVRNPLVSLRVSVYCSHSSCDDTRWYITLVMWEKAGDGSVM